MQRAGHKRTASRHTASNTPTAGSPRRGLAAARRESATAATLAGDSSVAEVLLSPAGTFASGPASDVDQRTERQQKLAIAIRQRIETRLPGRVRKLLVRVHGSTVVLDGQCSTYYTKQLAQHAALGILDDEQLENSIVVSVPR